MIIEIVALSLVFSSAEAAKNDAKDNVNKGVNKAKNAGKEIVDDTKDAVEISKS